MLIFPVKMLVVSGVLWAYYQIWLRNRSFHSFNRFFLLGMAGLSVFLPLVVFSVPEGWVFWQGHADSATAVGMSHSVIGGGSAEKSIAVGVSWKWVAWGAYAIGVGIFIYPLVRSLAHLRRLAKRSEQRLIEGVRVYLTCEPSAPFSFFSTLYWNSGLDWRSEAGQQIFRHELYHIRQRHTLDIVSMELLRSICWFNPFFHWVLSELRAVHEFGADTHVLEGGGAYEYARMLVCQDAGPSPTRLSHSFFHTELKRRISMITQSYSNRSGRLVRWMALPLAVLLTAGIGAQGSGLTPMQHIPMQDTGRHKIDPVLHHYLRMLRYPESALDAGNEQTVWFSIKVDSGGAVTDFQAYDMAPDEKGKIVYEVTVTSLPRTLPTGGRSLTATNMRDVFIEEARKASSNMQGAAREPQFKAGEYLIRIIFRLEKKPGTDSSLSLSIEQRAPVHQ